MDHRIFQCAECGGTFVANNTLDEKEKEGSELSADEPLEEGDEWVSVCTKCHVNGLRRIAAQPHRKAAPVAFKLLRTKWAGK